MIHDETQAPWPVIHLADAAKGAATCGRSVPMPLMTIRYDTVNCVDCILIDNEHRARVREHASPA